MNRYLSLIPAAAAAALLLPTVTGGRSSRAEATQPVQPALLVAAVDRAEAERRAALPPKAVPHRAAAELDRLTGAADRIDPNRIDPKVALGALAR